MNKAIIVLAALGFAATEAAAQTAPIQDVCVHALTEPNKGAWFITSVVYAEGSGYTEKLWAGQRFCARNPSFIQVGPDALTNIHVRFPGFDQPESGSRECTIKIWGTVFQAYYSHDCPVSGTVKSVGAITPGT